MCMLIGWEKRNLVIDKVSDKGPIGHMCLEFQKEAKKGK